MMKNRVLNTIKKHNLINKGDKVLIALSGGSDSVSLLHLLNDLKDVIGFEIYTCHLNHSIRDEADDDCEFVKKLSTNLGIECFTKKLDIKGIAKQEKISEELAGRKERYEFFDEISKKYNINLIATAHNKNDVAETILMHIIRGSGIDGMCGIAYKRGNIIRPLLDIEKSDIEKYCEKNDYKFVIDKTNSQSIYTRNKIRLELIPEICEKYNPSFIDTLVKNSENIRSESEYMKCEAKKIYNKVKEGKKINIDKLKTLHIAMVRRIILMMYNDYTKSDKNMQSVHVESIVKLVMSGKSGTFVNIDNNIKCVSESGWIYFVSDISKKKEFQYKLELNKEIFVKEIDSFVLLKEWDGTGEKFFFDNCENIFIRNRKNGDIFYPVGMNGKKKISDFFTDKKIPLSERNNIPIISCDNEIAWIVGMRKDRRFIKGENAYTILINKRGGLF